MQVNAQLNVDVVALQADDEVTCLLTFDAPIPPGQADRPGETIVMVVDRSGSMGGARIAAVRSSLHSLYGRLKPQDTFGVVTFDSRAAVAVPCRSVAEHDADVVHGLIDAVREGGTTDLSAGYLLGLAEARRHAGATGATVMVLSDGHVNSGIVDPDQLGGLAALASGDRITTSSIGIGNGYDESLLSAMSLQGKGAHRFAHTPDDAIAVVSEEAGDLLAKSVLNAFVRIKPADPRHLGHIGLLHEVSSWLETDADGESVIVVALGDLFAGQQRQLLVHFDIPALAELGLTQLATLTIEYVSLPDIEAHKVTWPIAVNVVPGDEAAGRVPNPTVETARLLAASARAKKTAAQSLREGDTQAAAQLMDEQCALLAAASVDMAAAAPLDDAIASRLAEEQGQLSKLARTAREHEALLASKSFEEDAMMSLQGLDDSVRRQRSRNKRDF